MSKFIHHIQYVSPTCFGPHRSIFRSVLQAVFADLLWANTRTTRHVQPLRSCRKTSVTAGRVEQYAYYHITNLQIELVKNAPEDGLGNYEICQANISAE